MTECIPENIVVEISHLLSVEDLETLANCNRLFFEYTNIEIDWKKRLKNEFNIMDKRPYKSWRECYKAIYR